MRMTDNIEDVFVIRGNIVYFVTKLSLEFEIYEEYVEYDINWCSNKLVVCSQPHTRQ